MSQRNRLFVFGTFLFLLSLLFTGAALAQQQQTYNFPSGQGYLTYTVSYYSGTCYSGQYESWSYSNLVYVDPNGGQNSLGGGGAYFNSPGGYGCPAGGAQPAELTFGGASSGYVMTVSPTSTGENATIGFAGSVNPNYEVAGVFYAPPGSKSYADYSQTTMVGSSTSMSSSFQSSVSKSVTFGSGASSIFGSNSYSSTAGTSLTQVQDSSDSIDISYQKTQGYRINGPSDDALGLSHPVDQVAVWLNPLANLMLSSGAVNWTSYSWDSNDPAANIEIVYPTVYELQNPSWFQQYGGATWSYVEKTGWNPSGGLTNTDFANIASHDPYSSGSPSPDPTRYDGPVNGSTIPYQGPGCPNCQPSTWYWSSNYSVTDTLGQGAQKSYSVSFGTSEKFSVFKDLLSVSLQNTSSFTWTNKWSSTETNKVTQAATVSITGPAWGSGYSGPTEFNMYQDNIYGTYMFYPR